MLIILSGKSGSGKDTVADYLLTKGFTKLALATPVKDIVSIITGWDRELLEGTTEESRKFREEVKSPYCKTGRELLQYIGTDLFRNQLSEDVWINILISKIQKGVNYVVSDVRFNNEIKKLLELDDIKVKPIYIIRELGQSQNQGQSHSSETSLSFESFPYIYVENNSSYSDLYNKIDQILKEN